MITFNNLQLLAAAMLISVSSGRSDEVFADVASEPSASISAEPVAPPTGRSLTSGARSVELSLESLRDIGLDLKHLLKSASTSYDEVSIRPVSLITEPAGSNL